MSRTLAAVPEYEEELVNWARNVRSRPRIVERPRTLFELKSAVRRAAQNGRHIRALGSRWSFSGAVACNDVALLCESLSGLLHVARGPSWDGPLGEGLLPQAKVEGRAYVHVLAGTRLSDLLAALRLEQLGIATMGSSAGQLLAGLLATGSHGGDFDLPPPGDFLRALHLVCADGSERWIERAGAGSITSKGGVSRIAPSVDRAHVIYDDDLFRAALVSVGALGVLYSAVLEVRDAPCALQEVVEVRTWAEVRARLLDGTIFTHPIVPPRAAPRPGDQARYRSLEILIPPYPHPERNEHLVRVVERFEARLPTLSQWTRPDRTLRLLEQLRVFATVRDRDDAAYYDVIDALQQRARFDTHGFAPESDVLDTGSGAPTPVCSVEIAISTRGGRHVQLLDEMLATLDARRRAGQDFAGFWSVRFTRPSEALLAMQAREPTDPEDARIMHVEIFALQRLDLTRPGLSDPQRLEADNEVIVRDLVALARARGARLHWGQWSPPDVGHHISWYPGRDTWLRCKRVLGAGTCFDSDFTVRAGLAAFRPGWSALGAMPTAPSGAPTSTASLRVHPPAAIADGAGRVVLAAANGDGRPSSAWVGGPAWSAIGDFRDPRWVDGEVALARDGAGRVLALARCDDRRVHAAIRAPGANAFGALIALDGPSRFEGSPAVCTDAKGRVRVIATERAPGRGLRMRVFENDGDWDNAWRALPAHPLGAPVGSPAVTCDGEGRVEVLVRTATEVARWRARGPASDAPWDTANLGLSSRCDPVIVATARGVLALVVEVARPIAAWRRTEDANYAYEDLPGTATVMPGTRPSALALPSGDILVAFTCPDGQVHRAVRSADGTWKARPPIPASSVSGVGLALRGTRVVLATRAAHDIVQTCEIDP